MRCTNKQKCRLRQKPKGGDHNWRWDQHIEGNLVQFPSCFSFTMGRQKENTNQECGNGSKQHNKQYTAGLYTVTA